LTLQEMSSWRASCRSSMQLRQRLPGAGAAGMGQGSMIPPPQLAVMPLLPLLHRRSCQLPRGGVGRAGLLAVLPRRPL
jgi:hypothetical protein